MTRKKYNKLNAIKRQLYKISTIFKMFAIITFVFMLNNAYREFVEHSYVATVLIILMGSHFIFEFIAGSFNEYLFGTKYWYEDMERMIDNLGDKNEKR